MLATASENVKIWEQGNSLMTTSLASSISSISDATSGFAYKLKASTTPLPNLSNSLCWNHTNEVVAVSCDNSRIKLYRSNGQLLSQVPFTDLQEFGSITGLHFSNNSRYLACGSNSNVHIWDLKLRNLRFESNNLIDSSRVRGTVTSVVFVSDTASDVAAGDAAGYIRIWSTKSTTLCSEDMVHSEGVAVNNLVQPYVGSSKLAAGYFDGSLVIWDQNTCQKLRSQVVHRNSTTGICYSPRNPRLIATVSLDGSMTLIDTSTRSTPGALPSALINVGDKLHSISFHDDSIHTAVGTSNGDILIYDWRSVRKPVFYLKEAHQNPIYAMKFQVHSKTSVSQKSAVKANQNSSIDLNESKMESIRSNLSSAMEKSISEAPADMKYNSIEDTVKSESIHPPRVSMSKHDDLNSTINAHTQDNNGETLMEMKFSSDPTLSTPPNKHLDDRVSNNSPNKAIEGDIKLERSVVKSSKLSPNQPTLQLSIDHLNIATKSNDIEDEIANFKSSLNISGGETKGAKKKSPSDQIQISEATEIQVSNESTASLPQPLSANQLKSPIISSASPRTSPGNGLNVETNNVLYPPTPPKPSIVNEMQVSPRSVPSSSTNKANWSSSSATLISVPTFNIDSIVTKEDLSDAIELLKYDMHKEIQSIIREQIRQFAISKVI